MTTNTTADQKIEELLAKINKQRNEVSILEKQAKNPWETNCSFMLLWNTPTNISTATTETIHKLLTQLISQKNASDEAAQLLGIEAPTAFAGYTFNQWLTDFKKRLAIITGNEKRRKLEDQEERITKLISPEKRREMELAALEAELNK